MKDTTPIGYKLSKRMFDTILTQCSVKSNPYIAVMDYINEQFDLKGKVTHLSIVDC